MTKKLLPIKSHFFFFMAAMGPILPQLNVYGKELGISSVVMGTVTGILPITFLLAKPLVGILFDVFKSYRRHIFITLILGMSVSFACINFIPTRNLAHYNFEGSLQELDSCNVTIDLSTSDPFRMLCSCKTPSQQFESISIAIENPDELFKLPQGNYSAIRTCSLSTGNVSTAFCNFDCVEDIDANANLYSSWRFWIFVLLLSLGSIGFNVANSISDALCFAVIGEEYDYGKQRLWGTIGFGVTALLSGYVVDMVSDVGFSYTPAFILMLVFTFLDLFSCAKLDMSIMETPKNIFKDITVLINNKQIITFIIFAILAGIFDGFLVYFLFWYLEDLAIETKTDNIKLIEGVIVAAETLGGEVLFFSIAGKILARIGHTKTFSLCFVFYALRLVLISFIASPWWALPVEFCMQGPTYALTYTTIVEYANDIAPKGATATMQGIAAGMDDGVGFAIGSVLGGFLYRYFGGTRTFQVFGFVALICGISYLTLQKTCLHKSSVIHENKEYKIPCSTEEEEAISAE